MSNETVTKNTNNAKTWMLAGVIAVSFIGGVQYEKGEQAKQDARVQNYLKAASITPSGTQIGTPMVVTPGK